MSTTRLSFYDADYKIGILGGGQLGRMFIQEAVNLDVNVHILDPDQSAPASKIAHHFICGSITDFNQVIEFGKDKQVVTIEIEHVNVDALEQLEKSGIKVFPQPHLIRMVQDKGLQKEFYRKHEIPTAPFKLIGNKNDLISLKEELPFVQKLRKGGYDGKGVQVMRTIADFDKGFDAPSVIEEMIEFEKELSVIVARNEHGETKAYPAVELVFNPEANLVEYLFSPADITSETEEKARKIALDLIKKMNLVGILAVEMFLTKSGDILVNEIAPRPHNSGHQTIEGSFTSQYEQHLRAVIGLPLGSTENILPSVMINLLGEKNHEGNVLYKGLEDSLKKEGVYPHIYGKTKTKPFRKMGHVTIINKSLVSAKKIAAELISVIKVESKK